METSSIPWWVEAMKYLGSGGVGMALVRAVDGYARRRTGVRKIEIREDSKRFALEREREQQEAALAEKLLLDERQAHAKTREQKAAVEYEFTMVERSNAGLAAYAERAEQLEGAHDECLKRVESMNVEFRDLSVKIAECETKHEHAEQLRDRDRAENERERARDREEMERLRQWLKRLDQMNAVAMLPGGGS